MATGSKGPDVAKATKLLEVAKEKIAQLHDLVTEIDQILGGGAGIGEKLKQVEIAWKTVWSSRYHSDYAFNYAKDRSQFKRLLKMFTPEDLQVRMTRYISTDDQYLVQRRHPLGLFITGINSYAAPGEAPGGFELDAEAPADCKHTPRCKTDVEHTAKRTADMRR